MTDLWITVNRNGQFLLSMTCRDLDLLLQGRADGNSGREVGDNVRASTLHNISSLKVCEATDFCSCGWGVTAVIRIVLTCSPRWFWNFWNRPRNDWDTDTNTWHSHLCPKTGAPEIGCLPWYSQWFDSNRNQAFLLFVPLYLICQIGGPLLWDPFVVEAWDDNVLPTFLTTIL